MEFLNRLIKIIIITLVFILLYNQEGYVSDIKLQESILTLRNRTIHTCHLSNVCNTLEIHIELVSLRNDGETNRVEHYGKE